MIYLINLYKAVLLFDYLTVLSMMDLSLSLRPQPMHLREPEGHQGKYSGRLLIEGPPRPGTGCQ